jgi:hypothetical protein
LITAPPGSAERVEVAIAAGIFSSFGVPPWFSGRQAETGGIRLPAPSEDPPEANNMQQDARSSDSDIHTGIITRETIFSRRDGTAPGVWTSCLVVKQII